MSPIFSDPDDQPVELEEGRGDLRGTSVPLSEWVPSSSFLGDRPVSYAQIVADHVWVGIAVMRLLTWSVRVPLKAYRRTDDEGGRRRLRPDDHQLARAIVTPWERGAMAHLVMSLLGPLLVHGNGLTDVEEGAGGRLRFDPVDWRRVMPIRGDDGEAIVGWTVTDARGQTTPRSADTTMHLRWWSPLGQFGISPLRQLGAAISSDRAAIEWALGNLRRGAKPSGMVKLSEEFLALEKLEREELLAQTRTDMRNAYGGSHNAGKLPVLPPGVDWTTAEHTTAVEAQLIQQREVNRNEVAAIYMVPPPMIGQLEKATYANITTQREMAYTDGLAPPLILIEQTLNAHLVAGMLREDDVFLEFDFAGILRGDRLAEIKALREAIGIGLLTPNEGRDVLNERRSDQAGANSLWMPRNNLQPIDSDPIEQRNRSRRTTEEKSA